jgi:hypothetical protein
VNFFNPVGRETAHLGMLAIITLLDAWSMQ